jgi:rhodanese-related sulfurtransferase
MQLITREELKAELDRHHDVKLVMAVGPWEFGAKHIPGSLGFPSPRYALSKLRHDDQIVLYANNHHRVNTRAAYDALRAHGYRNVRAYAGGLADWEAAGYPVEGTLVGPGADRRWPHGHSPHGRELNGACPHCDNGWWGAGWPPPPPAVASPLDGRRRVPHELDHEDALGKSPASSAVGVPS